MKKYYLILSLCGLIAALGTAGFLVGAAYSGRLAGGIGFLVGAFICFTITVTCFATIGFLALNRLTAAKKKRPR